MQPGILTIAQAGHVDHMQQLTLANMSSMQLLALTGCQQG